MTALKLAPLPPEENQISHRQFNEHQQNFDLFELQSENGFFFLLIFISSYYYQVPFRTVFTEK